MQQQVAELLRRAKTIEQINEVFKRVSELITLTDELDPMSVTLYEFVLERRTELQNQSQQWSRTNSWFPRRVPSLQSRAEAASGKRDPQRLERKRRFGGSSVLPQQLSGMFTEGERAVLYIVASDIRQTGQCCCTNKEIGDRAGVGLTTTRNALRKARTHGLISVEHREQWRGKNLSNIVRIVCTYWKRWLVKFRPNLGFSKRSMGVGTSTSLETYGIKEQKEKRVCEENFSRSGFVPAYCCRKPSYG